MATYDIAAFQLPAHAYLVTDQRLWELDGTGRAVTGILKLAQRVLLDLLTVKGSKPFDTNAGTSLLNFVRQGRIRNEIDAHTYFQYAVGELQQNMQDEETTDDPPDERFASLSIISLTFTPLQLAYSLKLLSMSGDSRTLTLPVPIMP